MTTSERLQTILSKQHQLIAHKLRIVSDNTGTDRQRVFNDLRRYLAAHEAASRVCINAATSLAPIAWLANARTEAEQDFAQTLEEMEAVGIDSADFNGLLQSLTSALVTHASAEENQNLTWIIGATTDPQMDRMLVALQTVPMVVAGNLRSVLMTDTFTYAALRQVALDHFDKMPMETISRLTTPDRPRYFGRTA